jgi:hypothetical protein
MISACCFSLTINHGYYRCQLSPTESREFASNPKLQPGSFQDRTDSMLPIDAARRASMVDPLIALPDE